MLKQVQHDGHTLKFSNPNDKMFLLLFLSKENETPKEGVNCHFYSRMLFDFLPCFFHFTGPVDVIKNKDGVIMYFREKFFKVIQGRLLLMITVEVYHIKRCFRFSGIWNFVENLIGFWVLLGFYPTIPCPLSSKNSSNFSTLRSILLKLNF